MKGLYLILDGLTLLFPMLLSFDKKVAYYKKWKAVFFASTVIAIPFLVWDAYFTSHGVWGFNENYLTGIHVYNLPIEEILFFWVVPFACTFIYECCKYYFRNINPRILNNSLILAMLALIITLGLISLHGWYTRSITISVLFTLFVWMRNRSYRFIGPAFLLSLIPFLVVNGVLTGSFIEEPIVWYSDAHFSGYRIFTIPVEDTAYSFTLIVCNILLTERFSIRKSAEKQA